MTVATRKPKKSIAYGGKEGPNLDPSAASLHKRLGWQLLPPAWTLVLPPLLHLVRDSKAGFRLLPLGQPTLDDEGSRRVSLQATLDG